MFRLISKKRLDEKESQIVDLQQKILKVSRELSIKEQANDDLNRKLEVERKQNAKLDADIAEMAVRVGEMQEAVDTATTNYQEKVDELQALRNGLENYRANLASKFGPLVSRAQTYLTLMAQRNAPPMRKRARYDLFEQICHVGTSIGEIKVKRDLATQIKEMSFSALKSKD